MTHDQKVALPLILGLFALPIILVLVQRSRSGGVSSNSRGRARITYESVEGFQPVALNEEIWEWTDYRGRNRSLKVHRQVSNR